MRCPHCKEQLRIVEEAVGPGTAKFLATYINLDGEQMFFWADLPEHTPLKGEKDAVQ